MDNQLADKRQVVLILRLVLNKQGQLLHGEIVDVAYKVIGRFANWTHLNYLMQMWLVNKIEGEQLNSE
jgi:hypothetical protein